MECIDISIECIDIPMKCIDTSMWDRESDHSLLNEFPTLFVY